MKKLLILIAAGCLCCTGLVGTAKAADPAPVREIAPGPYKPEWSSLKQYDCPEWFRDAKFGIWAHWTAQCVPEQGDWYAREMYLQGHSDYQFQTDHYGHPSKAGFKEIDNLWHAEHWDPEKLMDLYQRAGAKYFVALANHHDNFDCWDSKFQDWNSVKVGPHKDIVGTWAAAARKRGLRFGVTVHAARAWDWFDVSHGADKTGPLAGVHYDGWLTKADGKGTWWEGLDPAELYGPAGDARTPAARAAYVTKWFNRTKDLIDSYNPDLLYFDDTMAPLGEAGMNIFAHYYNANIQRHDGKNEAILNTKGMPRSLLKSLVHDYERGRSDRIETYPWQTDTCIGDWHYRRSIFEKHQYKPARQVIRMLADIVSKNGNLLLNIPVRGDGTIDDDEIKFLKDMAAWMDVNGEAIFGTRPWRVAAEGPVKVRAGGFSEGGEDKFTGQDFRFTAKDIPSHGATAGGQIIYAIAMDWPGETAVIKSLATGSPLVQGDVAEVDLLGHDGKLEFTRTPAGLSIRLPADKPCDHAFAFRIKGLTTVPAPAALAAGPVAAAADGSITLTADAADLDGDSIQVETRGDVSNIGFWDNANESASWKAKITRLGTYEVTARVATANPSTLAVDVGGKSVKADLPGTGGWDKFATVQLGNVEVGKAGEVVVKARAADAKTWRAVNLVSVTLKPKT